MLFKVGCRGRISPIAREHFSTDIYFRLNCRDEKKEKVQEKKEESTFMDMIQKTRKNPTLQHRKKTTNDKTLKRNS